MADQREPPTLSDVAGSRLSGDQVLVLWEVARVANEGLELRSTLQRITDLLATRFGWELVALVRILPEENRFECQAVTSTLPTQVKPGYSRPLGSGVVGHVAQTGEALLLDDVQDFHGFVETLDHTASEICVPIRHQGQVVGVLNAESSKPAQFRDQKLLFEAVAEQISGAVARGLLYEESRLRAELLETLADVSRRVVDGRDLNAQLQELVEYLQRRFNLVLAAVLVSDEKARFWQDRAIAGNEISPQVAQHDWPIDVGIVGRAVKSGRTLLVPDVDADPDYLGFCDATRAELVIPLRFRDRILGALNLEARSAEDLAPNTVRAFESIAAQVSGAVELAVSHRRLRESERQLAAANRELSKANKALNRLTLVDSLTGLANRRRFDRHLEEEWRRAARHSEHLTVALIDVDHFKAYNDAYGHPAGDECLRQVANCLAEQVGRAGELAARYGGEEFVLVLPRLGGDEALALVERVRRAIEGLAIAHGASGVADHLTVSAGLATIVPDTDLRIEALLTAADDALYQAKDNGRNRTEVAAPAGG